MSSWNKHSYPPHHHSLNNALRHFSNHLSRPLPCHQLLRTFVTAPILHAEMVDVTFITNDGKKLKTKGKIGDNLLDVVVNNSVDLDGFGKHILRSTCVTYINFYNGLDYVL